MKPTPDHILFVTFLLVLFEKKVEKLLEENGQDTIGHYTPHGMSHLKGVKKSIDYILTFHGNNKKQKKEKLTTIELLILEFCALGHDLGMHPIVAEIYDNRSILKDMNEQQRAAHYRKQHDQASAYYMRKTIPRLFEHYTKIKRGTDDSDIKLKYEKDILERIRKKLAHFELDAGKIDERLNELIKKESNELWVNHSKTITYSVILVASYHRRAEEINNCPDTRMLFGKAVRTKLLAAIFRLSDALHVDRTRFSKDPYEFFRVQPEFTDESRVHWIKSFIVSSITIKEKDYSVHVQADIPARLGGDDIDEKDSIKAASLRDMLEFIVTDLEEDVVSVSYILVKNNFPPLLQVTHEVHKIPEMDYKEDIQAALNSVLASTSPNTSQLIRIALNSIRTKLDLISFIEFGEEDEKKKERILQEMWSQFQAIHYQLKKRPCHEGLLRVKHFIYIITKLFNEKKGTTAFKRIGTLSSKENIMRSDVFWTFLDGVIEVFDNQRKSIVDKSKKISKNKALKNLFESATDIVVYGFSLQVILVLEDYFRYSKKWPKIRVLECRTKTRYSPAGHLLYLDGQRYAKKLREKLPNEANILLEPDVSLAHHIYRKGKDSKLIILLGSNAVYAEDGTFIHSMGHLTVAALAKYAPNCEVIVVTDSMKIGTTPPVEEERERNPEKWLTHNRTVIDELRKQRVELHNWREDRVARDFIDRLLVLDKNELLSTDNAEELAQKLKGSMFNEIEIFCSELPIRLLAAYLAKIKKTNLDLRKAMDKLHPKESSKNKDWLIAIRYIRHHLGNSLDLKQKLPAELLEHLNNIWDKDLDEAVKSIITILKQKHSELKKPVKKDKMGIEDFKAVFFPATPSP